MDCEVVNIKMVINSTCDYCALYVRTMYVIMADGTFPIQSNLLMHSLSIKWDCRVTQVCQWTTHVNHFIYICYVNIIFCEQVINHPNHLTGMISDMTHFVMAIEKTMLLRSVIMPFFLALWRLQLISAHCNSGDPVRHCLLVQWSLSCKKITLLIIDMHVKWTSHNMI